MAVTEYKTALLVAAHPDDEVLGAGGWAAAFAGELAVAFLTDGVPQDPKYYAAGQTDAATYRDLRQREARAAWRRLRPAARLYFGTIADQSLTFNLARAGSWLDPIIARECPQLLLTPAYEGGHPDHDAANCLVARRAAGRTVWEYALYSLWRGSELHQQFPDGRDETTLSGTALEAKQAALDEYHSQRATLAGFSAERESMRPLPTHEYSRPAREVALYERWGWPWRAQQLATVLARSC